MKFSQKMRGVGLGLILCLGMILGLGGCATRDAELWPPAPGTPTQEVYVSLDTWHAMIAFPRKNDQDQHAVTDAVNSLPTAHQQTAFEEWGYAERAWYLEGRQGLAGVLRALFWPSEGVVEIAEYNQIWAKRTPQPPSDMFTFQVSQEGYQRLRDHLRSTMMSSQSITTFRGSRFFSASQSYHLFHNCHHYVARAIQKAGIPLSTFWAITRSTLRDQLQQAENLANEVRGEG